MASRKRRKSKNDGRVAMAIAAVFFGPGLVAVVWQWVLDHRLWLLFGLLAVGGVAITVWRVREAERRAQFAALRRVEVTDTMTGTTSPSCSHSPGSVG